VFVVLCWYQPHTVVTGSGRRLGLIMPATLRLLLESQEIELELRHGDPESAFTAVRHADRSADRPWLSQGDLRLTEAAFTLPRPTVDPLFEPRPTALVYVLEPRRRNVPDDLVQRCTAGDVALLVASASTSPERLEELALGALLAASGPGLASLASVQRYLVAALDGSKPEREMLDRLTRLSGTSLVLLAPWGEPLARAGGDVGRLTPLDLESLPEGRVRL